MVKIIETKCFTFIKLSSIRVQWHERCVNSREKEKCNRPPLTSLAFSDLIFFWYFFETKRREKKIVNEIWNSRLHYVGAVRIFCVLCARARFSYERFHCRIIFFLTFCWMNTNDVDEATYNMKLLLHRTLCDLQTYTDIEGESRVSLYFFFRLFSVLHWSDDEFRATTTITVKWRNRKNRRAFCIHDWLSRAQKRSEAFQNGSFDL